VSIEDVISEIYEMNLHEKRNDNMKLRRMISKKKQAFEYIGRFAETDGTDG
jgi:hypothetical protein